MPPKKTSRKPRAPKKTPEQLEQEFEDWKKTPEYDLLVNMRNVWDTLNIGDSLNGTEDDLKFRIHPFLDDFQKIGTIFKIKNSKIKEVTQEHIRVAFFAGYQDRNEDYTIDSKEYKIEDNETNIDSDRVKSDFMNIKRFVTDGLADLSSESFLAERKKLTEDYKNFVKYFKKFTKKNKAFTEAKDMMNDMLKPLQSLLECSMGLTIIDFEYPEEINYEVNNFRYKALITTFCKCYMTVQTLMFENPKIDTEGTVKKALDGNPDIYSILKKFQYQGWRGNNVESFYIQPLMDAFMKLRADMTKMYLLGFSRS